MIIDITGVILIPGDRGKSCPGNGTHQGMECCCEECDYQMCCYGQTSCADCTDKDCPHSGKVCSN